MGGPSDQRPGEHGVGQHCAADRPADLRRDVGGQLSQAQAGLATFEENDTSCCYALQDKVWVHGPGAEPWEVYVVKADADVLGKSATDPENQQAPCACGQATGQSTEETADRTRPVTVSASPGCC
ncbi:hypothetical protein ACQPYK_05025 [Streptosporangium sp. CA-135522]|uniref:hypothetical protein n=1 Tax=Streptosporangium sp. CA-135522 TaxID=3240072 RepID=UPI003D8EF322